MNTTSDDVVVFDELLWRESGAKSLHNWDQACGLLFLQGGSLQSTSVRRITDACYTQMKVDHAVGDAVEVLLSPSLATEQRTAALLREDEIFHHRRSRELRVKKDAAVFESVVLAQTIQQTRLETYLMK